MSHVQNKSRLSEPYYSFHNEEEKQHELPIPPPKFEGKFQHLSIKKKKILSRWVKKRALQGIKFSYNDSILANYILWWMWSVLIKISTKRE